MTAANYMKRLGKLEALVLAMAERAAPTRPVLRVIQRPGDNLAALKQAELSRWQLSPAQAEQVRWVRRLIVTPSMVTAAELDAIDDVDDRVLEQHADVAQQMPKKHYVSD